MSKSKFTKIIIAVLSLCLVLGAVIGITASANDENEVIDFDSDYSKYLTITTSPTFAEENKWSVVDVDGNNKLLVNKHGVDTVNSYAGTKFKFTPTYVEDFANIATLEFDFTVIDASAYTNQFNLDHQGISGNTASPFASGFTIGALEEGVEHRIKATYRVTEFDTNGVPVSYEFVVEVDGEVVERVNTIYSKATKLKANGGSYDLPKASQVDSITFSLNNAFLGDVYFDNCSFKLTHEHVYVDGKCECGAEDPEVPVPVIWSKNIAYSSKTYLRYAVPVESIPVEDRVEGGVWMSVNKANGVHSFNKFPLEETQTVYGKECYIFETNGVPAKELNTVEMVYVQTASGAKSEVSYYSAEEYLYEKLYVEGYVEKTPEDGLDYSRRDLYYQLLAYGATAQELLAPYATDKIGDSVYVAPHEDLDAVAGFIEPDTYITLAYKGDSGDFLGWRCTEYDNMGNSLGVKYYADGSKITASGYICFTPIFDDGQSEAPEFELADETK